MRKPVIALLLLMPIACADQSNEIVSPLQFDASAIIRRATAQDYDHQLAEMAREAPGFAGWWIDNGVAVIATTDTANASVARAAVQRVIDRSTSLSALLTSSPQVKIVNVKFDFLTLFRWYEEKVLTFSSDHVISTDIGESKNRIIVGVRDQENVQRD